VLQTKIWYFLILDRRKGEKQPEKEIEIKEGSSDGREVAMGRPEGQAKRTW
jgi:hypothetical protein